MQLQGFLRIDDAGGTLFVNETARKYGPPMDSVSVALTPDQVKKYRSLNDRLVLIEGTFPQQEAARGRQYLMRFLTTDEAAAYLANPAKGAHFVGTAIHRATRRAWGMRRYNPNNGPGFVDTQTGELVELTTEAGCDASRRAMKMYRRSRLINYPSDRW